MKATERKKQLAEQIWLGYFNSLLFEQGMISESDRNKLALKIENRKLPSKTK